MADSYKQKVHPKVFCGEVDAGGPPLHNEEIPQIVVNMTEEQIMHEVEMNYQIIHLDIVNLMFKELNNPA